MIFAAFEWFIFARSLRMLTPYQSDIKARRNFFMNIINK